MQFASLAAVYQNEELRSDNTEWLRVVVYYRIDLDIEFVPSSLVCFISHQANLEKRAASAQIKTNRTSAVLGERAWRDGNFLVLEKG